MSTFSSTARKSLLDLVNVDNASNLTLDNTEVGDVVALTDSGDARNSKVTLNGKGPLGGQSVDVRFTRLDVATAFKSGTDITIVTEGKDATQVANSIRSALAAKTTVPLDSDTALLSYDNGVGQLDCAKHHILMGSLSFNVTSKALVDLAALLPNISITDRFAVGETFKETTSLEAFINFVNATAGIELDVPALSIAKPSAYGSQAPTDGVTFKPNPTVEEYKNSTTVRYNRLDVETLIPDVLEIDSYATYTEFRNTVTPEYMAKKLTDLLKIPFIASEVRVRLPNIVDDGFTAKITVVDNYLVRSSSGVNIHSTKSA